MRAANPASAVSRTRRTVSSTRTIGAFKSPADNRLTYCRPPESFRRALRRAQGHADKAVDLSQKLDRLTAQLDMIVKRNNRMTTTAAGHDLSRESQRDNSPSTTAQCPVERWPEVCGLLRKAQTAKGVDGKACARVIATANEDRGHEISSRKSCFGAPSGSRKRKRRVQRGIDFDFARYVHTSVSSEGDRFN